MANESEQVFQVFKLEIDATDRTVSALMLARAYLEQDVAILDAGETHAVTLEAAIGEIDRLLEEFAYCLVDDAAFEQKDHDGYYSAASARHAQQTKARCARKREAAEVERLRKLGADEAWITRVTTGGRAR